jgi:rubrerythrin
MEHQTTLGHNRTGVQMSPIDAARMKSGADAMIPEAGDGEDHLRVRQSYSIDGGLGTVPVPATATGVLKSGAQMLTGKRPQVLVDKLGERVAFERGGVRLYETLIAKCDATPQTVSVEVLTELRRFRNEEAEHMRLVVAAIEQIGADPTAQTPCADLVGVESLGLVQAMNDPRTTILQSLHVMLDAELLDNAAWEMLIELTRAAGHDDIATGFEAALQQENEHLIRLRALVSGLTMADAGTAPDSLADQVS